MGTRYRTNHNAFNSSGASLTRKHDGFQCGMCDNILSFNGFNHLIKSWTVCLLVMIQAKGTPVRWSSNPIKVNRWNFMSFVPNVASIEMAPLWPYDSMDSHWVGVWIPMVNGTWVPFISPTSCKKNTSSGCWRAQDRIEIIGLVCKRQLPFLCFRSKYAMSWSQMKSSRVMLWPAFTRSHQIVLCLSYICFVV